MWFLSLLPVLTLAHISFTPALLPEELHDFTLKVIWKPLFEAKEAIPWALKLADQISPLALATSLHFAVESDESFKQAFLAELLSKPEYALEVAEKISDFQLSVSTFTEGQFALLSNLEMSQLMGLNMLIVCYDSRYLQLLWEKCKDELINEADLGMAILSLEGNQSQALSEALNPSQAALLAYIQGKDTMPDNIDEKFLASIIRWSPLADRKRRERLLAMLFNHAPPNLLQSLPRTLIPAVMEPSIVLDALSTSGKRGLCREYLWILAEFVSTNRGFWAKLAKLSVANSDFSNIDWRAFVSSISGWLARRNILVYYLPVVLNEVPYQIIPFLRKNCRLGPDFTVKCLVGRSSLRPNQHLVQIVLHAQMEDMEDTDKDGLASSLLAHRFLLPQGGISYAVLRKALLLDLGDLMPLSLLLSVEYPSQVDDALFFKLASRLLRHADQEISQWPELFKKMETWLPRFVPHFLTNHPGFFFQPDARGGFKPTAEALGLEMRAIRYFVQHGKEQIRSMPGLRFPLWLKLLRSLNEHGVEPAIDCDLSEEADTPLLAFFCLISWADKGTGPLKERGLTNVIRITLSFLAKIDPHPDYARDYPFILALKRDEIISRLTDPAVLQMLEDIEIQY